MQLNSLCLILLAAIVATAGTVIADEGIKVRQILGPKDPGGKYKHPASITQLRNGDLYVAFYGGAGEYEGDTAVWGSRLAVGKKKWTPPVIIADTPYRSEGNGVVWQAPDGLVWLFYVVRYGETWSASRINAKISKDGARTWSDPMMLTHEQGTMVRGQPIVLKGGDYLLPIYHETGEDREVVGATSKSLFVRFNPRKKEWTETARISSKNGNIQPAVAVVKGDHLVAYCRRTGGYGPEIKGHIIRAESHDGGRTWSEGVDSEFPNPNAAVEFLRLKNGHLLLVYNNSMSERDPLTAAISTDGDKTYKHRRDIIKGTTGGGDYAYPYAIQAKDGKIHLIFTSHERSVINHAVFDESAITGSRTRERKK